MLVRKKKKAKQDIHETAASYNNGIIRHLPKKTQDIHGFAAEANSGLPGHIPKLIGNFTFTSGEWNFVTLVYNDHTTVYVQQRTPMGAAQVAEIRLGYFPSHIERRKRLVGLIKALGCADKSILWKVRNKYKELGL